MKCSCCYCNIKSSFKLCNNLLKDVKGSQPKTAYVMQLSLLLNFKFFMMHIKSFISINPLKQTIIVLFRNEFLSPLHISNINLLFFITKHDLPNNFFFVYIAKSCFANCSALVTAADKFVQLPDLSV